MWKAWSDSASASSREVRSLRRALEEKDLEIHTLQAQVATLEGAKDRVASRVVDLSDELSELKASRIRELEGAKQSAITAYRSGDELRRDKIAYARAASCAAWWRCLDAVKEVYPDLYSQIDVEELGPPTESVRSASVPPISPAKPVKATSPPDARASAVNPLALSSSDAVVKLPVTEPVPADSAVAEPSMADPLATDLIVTEPSRVELPAADVAPPDVDLSVADLQDTEPLVIDGSVTV